jgi:hypothetical protein
LSTINEKRGERKGFERAYQYIFSNLLLSTFFLLFSEYLSCKLGFVINYYVNQSKDFIKIYFIEINQINFSSIKKKYQINLPNISSNFRDLFSLYLFVAFS